MLFESDIYRSWGYCTHLPQMPGSLYPKKRIASLGQPRFPIPDSSPAWLHGRNTQILQEANRKPGLWKPKGLNRSSSDWAVQIGGLQNRGLANPYPLRNDLLLKWRLLCQSKGQPGSGVCGKIAFRKWRSRLVSAGLRGVIQCVSFHNSQMAVAPN